MKIPPGEDRVFARRVWCRNCFPFLPGAFARTAVAAPAAVRSECRAAGDERTLGSGLRHDLGFLVGHLMVSFVFVVLFFPAPAPAGREGDLAARKWCGYFSGKSSTTIPRMLASCWSVA